MIGRAKYAVFVALLATSAQVTAAEWKLQPAVEGHGAVLTYGSGEAVSYKFECVPAGMLVTETGVTKLLDLRTGETIKDGPNAVMPAGAALMALYGGKGEPKFVPAEAVKNSAGGWDLTIRLKRGDKQLKAIGKSEMISLFTTGFTMAVTMDDTARVSWNDFMQRCNATL